MTTSIQLSLKHQKRQITYSRCQTVLSTNIKSSSEKALSTYKVSAMLTHFTTHRSSNYASGKTSITSENQKTLITANAWIPSPDSEAWSLLPDKKVEKVCLKAMIFSYSPSLQKVSSKSWQKIISIRPIQRSPLVGSFWSMMMIRICR